MMAPAIRYEEARSRLEAAVRQIADHEVISCEKALGRVASEDVTSPLNLPETSNAAVDGYAVSSVYLAAHPTHHFTVAGTAKAGHPYDKPLLDGQALRMFTGAVMPQGADCVMMQEFCEAENDMVRFPSAMSAGKNSRPAGENLAKDEVILKKGEVIGPAQIGQLAAAGLAEVAVVRPLRVGILSTGDELVQTATHKKSGQIYDSNRPMIASLIKEQGHEVIDGGIIEDNREALARAYADLCGRCDMVISSGGASQGDEDHSQSALQDIGAELLFWRVAIKPGRPVAAAIKADTPLFCLPGNPVAVFVCFHLFVVPTLSKLSHNHFKPLTSLRIKSGFAVKKPKNERAEFRRVKLALTNEGETVMVPHGRKGAGVLSSLTGADGLAELAYELGEVPEGQKLPFIML